MVSLLSLAVSYQGKFEPQQSRADTLQIVGNAYVALCEELGQAADIALSEYENLGDTTGGNLREIYYNTLADAGAAYANAGCRGY